MTSAFLAAPGPAAARQLFRLDPPIGAIRCTPRPYRQGCSIQAPPDAVRRVVCSFAAPRLETVRSTEPVPAISPALISAFRRDGLAVIEQVMTTAELERLARIMAPLYRRYRSLAR
jgi:hypothetical protein